MTDHDNLSFSADRSAAAGDLPTGPSTGRRRHRLARLAGILLVLLMVGLVVGPIAYVGLPREIARWHLAAAIERRLNGDLDAAIRSLDHLIAQSPDNEELLAERASWRLENQQYATALADANRALQIAPGDARALVLRSQILQHLGRHSDAIQDWQQLVVMAENGLAVSLTEALNGRAYARALGGVELKEALDDVEEALRRAGDNAAMLDTRGFIHCQLGSTAAALADLDKSVRLAEEGHEEYSRNLNNGRLGAVDPREYELGLKQLAETVAVIRYHRALVYAKLGKQELQDQDEQRVRELGFAPNQDLF